MPAFLRRRTRKLLLEHPTTTCRCAKAKKRAKKRPRKRARKKARKRRRKRVRGPTEKIRRRRQVRTREEVPLA